MRLLAAVFTCFLLLPQLALAGSTLVYEGRGKIQSVVRQGPSGAIIYDGRGNIVSAVRERGAGVGIILRTRDRGVRAMGTTLHGGVGDEG